MPSHEYGYLSLNIIKNDFLICLSLPGQWDLGKKSPTLDLGELGQLGEHQRKEPPARDLDELGGTSYIL